MTTTPSTVTRPLIEGTLDAIVGALTALRDDYNNRAAAADADRNHDLSAYLTAKRDGVHDAIHEARMAVIVAANAAAVTA